MGTSGDKRKAEPIRWTTSKPAKRTTDSESRFMWWLLIVVGLLVALAVALKAHEDIVFWWVSFTK
jgi:hypothetical protein